MDIGVVINVLIVFGTLFGIVYIILSARTRVRLALIEKGADASIFVSDGSRKKTNIFPLILVNIALLLAASGIGIFVGAIMSQSMGVNEGVAYPGSILTLSGIALFIGYRIASNTLNSSNS